MPRMDCLSDYRTTVSADNAGGMVVIYVSTPIVRWTAETVELRNGGWRTVTTKRKMNQTANQFALGFQVFQRDHEWFVRRSDGSEMPFVDGMVFAR